MLKELIYLFFALIEIEIFLMLLLKLFALFPEWIKKRLKRECSLPREDKYVADDSKVAEEVKRDSSERNDLFQRSEKIQAPVDVNNENHIRQEYQKEASVEEEQANIPPINLLSKRIRLKMREEDNNNSYKKVYFVQSENGDLIGEIGLDNFAYEIRVFPYSDQVTERNLKYGGIKECFTYNVNDYPECKKFNIRVRKPAILVRERNGYTVRTKGVLYVEGWS